MATMLACHRDIRNGEYPNIPAPPQALPHLEGVPIPASVGLTAPESASCQ
jgi:hypothetical protein